MADIDFKCKVDTTGFDLAFKEYLRWNRRQPAQLVNTKLYFVAAQAIKNTKSIQPGTIKAELDKVGTKTKRPNTARYTIGELLAFNRLRKKNGKISRSKKFNLRERLDKEVQKIVNRRKSHIGFIKTGWKAAMAKLDFWNKKDAADYAFSKRFAPKDALQAAKGVKIVGNKPKGDIRPAKLEQLTVRGTIFSLVGEGKQATPTIRRLLLDGLNKGIIAEINSMRTYISRKNQEFLDKLKSKTNLGVK